jgi:hypothetical protein
VIMADNYMPLDNDITTSNYEVILIPVGLRKLLFEYSLFKRDHTNELAPWKF